jgi:hypothetical protein
MPGLGAEIDLRSQGNKIILHHDAFESGNSFEDFLKIWVQKHLQNTLILNPKEDGLERIVLELLNKYSITKYFFLDLPTPTIVRLCRKENLKKLAVRISEFETIESALRFEGFVDWVWVDSFEGRVTDQKILERLQKSFKLCLVSPELQGYPIEKISEFMELQKYFTAVCTKNPQAWGFK